MLLWRGTFLADFEWILCESTSFHFGEDFYEREKTVVAQLKIKCEYSSLNSADFKIAAITLQMQSFEFYRHLCIARTAYRSVYRVAPIPQQMHTFKSTDMQSTFASVCISVVNDRWEQLVSSNQQTGFYGVTTKSLTLCVRRACFLFFISILRLEIFTASTAVGRFISSIFCARKHL